MAQTSQQLPSKEASLFRHVIQNFESKHYKKGLKAAEQILRKHPNHGDTQAMKALILNSQGNRDEAFELCKLALRNAMKSHVCWHVYGLLYRSVKNYEEAIKAYRFALKLDPNNPQIQRDLAPLQMQIRDYAGYVQTRRQMLQLRPGVRQNWTALAVGLHLSGELAEAEETLQMYEGTLTKSPPPRTDSENAEAVLYKNTIIAERGELDRALNHIEEVYKIALDRTSAMEMRADYLLRLGKLEEAEKAYRELLDRNAEKRVHYEGLEKALGLDRSKSEDHAKLGEMYHSYGVKNERTDAARRLPLDFKQGEAFKEHAEKYLRRMFKKGVPSTFANLKQLYTDPAKKEMIRQLVEGFAHEETQTNGGAEADEVGTVTKDKNNIKHITNGDTTDAAKAANTWNLSVNYFLAQHYDYHLSRDLSKAQKYIENAIALRPSKTDYTFNMTRARILKHLGNTQKASSLMEEARKMDLKDRYINTKSAKYQLRNEQNQDAVNTMGLFTRKEAVGGPLGDLLDMQCVWFITEDGESYMRQGKFGLALKRFKAVYDIFELWQEDQTDFHGFSLRKGMIRAYVEMIRWEDKLREHPFFTRAALSAIRIYLMLYDNPRLAADGNTDGVAGDNVAEKKKAAKKAKKEAEKAEADRKANLAKKPQPKADEEGTAKKEDADPAGLEAFKTAAEKPLEEAMKYLRPLLELSPKNIDGQIAGFEVYVRRKKYLPALKCLVAAQQINSEHPACHEMDGRLKFALAKLEEPLPAKAKEVIVSSYQHAFDSESSLGQHNEDYLTKHRESVRHVHSAVRLQNVLEPGSAKTKTLSVENLLQTLTLNDTSLAEASEGLRVLQELGLGEEAREKYAAEARQRWPEATVFQLQAIHAGE